MTHHPQRLLTWQSSSVCLALVSRWHPTSLSTWIIKGDGPQVCRPSLHHCRADKNSSSIVWGDNVIRALCSAGKLGGFLCFRLFKCDIWPALSKNTLRALWDVNSLCLDAVMDLGWWHSKWASFIPKMDVSQAHSVDFFTQERLWIQVTHSQTSQHKLCLLCCLLILKLQSI